MPGEEEAKELSLEALDALVGEWEMASSFAPDPASAPRARTTFEWLPGRRFLIQRWEVDFPAAPDGIAVIGFDADGKLVQNYFDSRGVARVYEMSFGDGVWTLERHAEPPDFSQRFRGEVSADGDKIAGRWESAHDGSEWELDFELTYTRVVPVS